MSKQKHTLVDAVLSHGEALHIARRRAGRTQEQEADWHDVPLLAYHKWEADVESRDRDGKIRHPPSVKLTWASLADVERCYVLRRRSGKSRAAVASALGVSEHWLSAMEAGRQSAARLLTFWGLGTTGRRA